MNSETKDVKCLECESLKFQCRRCRFAEYDSRISKSNACSLQDDTTGLLDLEFQLRTVITAYTDLQRLMADRELHWKKNSEAAEARMDEAQSRMAELEDQLRIVHKEVAVLQSKLEVSEKLSLAGSSPSAAELVVPFQETESHTLLPSSSASPVPTPNVAVGATSSMVAATCCVKDYGIRSTMLPSSRPSLREARASATQRHAAALAGRTGSVVCWKCGKVSHKNFQSSRNLPGAVVLVKEEPISSNDVSLVVGHVMTATHVCESRCRVSSAASSCSDRGSARVLLAWS